MTAKNPTTILIAASSGDAGRGGDMYLLQIVQHLDYDRYRPVVVLPAEGTLRPILEEKGIRVSVVPVDYGWLSPDPAWYRFLETTSERVRTFTEIIQEHHVGLVHTNSNFHLDAAFAGLLCGVPHLYLAHAEHQAEVSIFVRLGLGPQVYAQLMDRISTRILAVSQSVADLLSPPADPAKIRVVHNGVETERFDKALAVRPRQLHRELNLPEDAIIVTGVGRLVPEKGFDFLLQAATRIVERFPEAHFVIAGDGGENLRFEAHLRELGSTHGLAGHLHFLGFRKDIALVLAETDIFVLSSRREGHPYSLLEAMAARCAPVAFNCQGVEETLIPDVTGVVVPREDTQALEQAIATLLEDDSRRETLAQAAYRDVHARFTAEKSMAGLMAAYEEILSLPPPLPGDPGIALFLRTCHEFGVIGRRMVEAEQRIHYLEGFMHQVKDNPLIKALRWMRKGLQQRRRTTT